MTSGKLKILQNKSDISIDYLPAVDVSADKVAFTLAFYPYSQEFNADSYKFLPFEEYAIDLADGHVSSYAPIKDAAGKIFGIILGLALATIFALIDLDLLISIEAAVSILGAYAIGKELWSDIDIFLTDLTRAHKISWREAEYRYKREEFGTIQKYLNHARDVRYNRAIPMPQKFEFSTHSNSKIVELLYSKSNVTNSAAALRILNISSEKRISLFMLSAKIDLISNFFFFSLHREFFQCLDGKKLMALDDLNAAHPKALLCKTALTIGRLKINLNQSIVSAVMIDAN